MSTHNISFSAEIRKIPILLAEKKPALSGAMLLLPEKKISGPSCLKLKMSLVNLSLKF